LNATPIVIRAERAEMGFVVRDLERLARDESGQSAVAMLLMFFAVFVIAGLAADGGLWYFDHRTAQNQVDASALAAVQELPASTTSAAVSAAQDWLSHNGVSIALAEAGDCNNMSPGSARIVFSNQSGGEYYSVRVCLRRNSPVTLSALANVTDAIVSAGATANVRVEPLTYALMAMNPDGCSGGGDGLRSLNFTGNSTVNLLQDGSSYTRSSCDGGMYVDGSNAIVDAEGAHDVVGACAPASRCASSQVNPDPTNNYGTSLTDPFASYMQPVPGSCRTDLQPIYTSGTHSLAPGTYCIPLQISSSAVVTLRPGTHVFRAGVMVSGNSSRLIANDALLYFTCATGQECGGSQAPASMQPLGCSDPATFCLQGGSGSAATIVGPSTTPGIAIWVDRTAGPPAAVNNRTMVRIAGQGTISISGNIYAITSTVTLQGQGSGQNISLTGTIVGDKIVFTGEATYNVTWDADLAPKVLDYALID
jgi:Flp pilus assembly protein TadG